MAQAVIRHDEVELDSLSRANEKMLLQKDANDQQMSGAFVPAEELNYVPRQVWKFTEGGAELIGGFVLNVDGLYQTGVQLIQGLTYEVNFEVLLKDNFNIKTMVNRTLTLPLPDGSTQESACKLMEYPRNISISLKAGEFINDYMFMPGEMKFTLTGSEHNTWKQGLVLLGVRISPINTVPK